MRVLCYSTTVPPHTHTQECLLPGELMINRELVIFHSHWIVCFNNMIMYTHAVTIMHIWSLRVSLHASLEIASLGTRYRKQMSVDSWPKTFCTEIL